MKEAKDTTLTISLTDGSELFQTDLNSTKEMKSLWIIYQNHKLLA